MNIRHYYSYYSHFPKFFNSDLHLFELSVWIQSFALSLISVFVPIILWKTGLNLFSIAAFYLLFNAFDVPLNFFAKWLISKYGARNAVIVAILFELGYFTTLFSLQNSFVHIAILALCLALFDTLYWVGHLYIFLEAAHKNSLVRTDVGALRIVRMIGGICAPFIGALVLISTSQQILILLATLCMVISLAPLFQMRKMHFTPQTIPPSFEYVFSAKREKINYGFEILGGIQAELEDVIWPFFIFITYGSLRTVSYIPMVVSFVGLFMVYITAQFSLKKRIYSLIGIGAGCLAVLWYLRLLFFTNIIFVLGSVFVSSIVRIFIDVPLEISIFERSHRNGTLSAVTYLNMFRMLGRALVYVVLVSVLLLTRGSMNAYFSAGFVLVFSAAVLLSYLSLRVRNRKIV